MALPMYETKGRKPILPLLRSYKEGCWWWRGGRDARLVEGLWGKERKSESRGRKSKHTRHLHRGGTKTEEQGKNIRKVMPGIQH